jgi:hypothetical protein
MQSSLSLFKMYPRFLRGLFSAKFVGHLFFLLLALTAVYYYKERLFADGAYNLIKIINSGNIDIDHGRFIGAGFQVFPWLAVKMGLGLKAIVMTYALSDVAFHYMLFLILIYWLKDEAHALMLLGSVIIGVLFSFYCTTELSLGAGLSILVFSILHKDKGRPRILPLVIVSLLIITIVFSHPLAFVLLLLMSGFFFTGGFPLKGKVYLSPLAAVYALSVIIRYLTLDDYDQKKILYHTDLSTNTFRQLFSLTYMREFIPFFVREYWQILVMAFITSAYYLMNRKRIQAFYLLFAILSYTALIVATHHLPYLSNYSERIYLPLVPLALYPFIRDIAANKAVPLQKPAYILFLLLMFLQLVHIFEFGKHYTARIDRLMSWVSLTRNDPGRRYIVDLDMVKRFNPDGGWAVPAETIIYSSLEGRDKTKALYLEDDWQAFHSGASDIRYIRRRDSVVNSSYVNPRYFSALTGPFKYISTLR